MFTEVPKTFMIFVVIAVVGLITAAAAKSQNSQNQIVAKLDENGRYVAILPDGRTITRYEIVFDSNVRIEWIVSKPDTRLISE